MARIILMTRENLDKVRNGTKTETRRISPRWMWLKIGDILDVRVSRGVKENLYVKVLDRRRQPLQDIKDREIVAEGFDPESPGSAWGWWINLWDSRHREPTETWEANPDVTVIRFERLAQ